MEAIASQTQSTWYGKLAIGQNRTVVKAAPAILHNVWVTNVNLLVQYYLKLYDKATAPDPAVDIPVMIVPMPVGAFGGTTFGPSGSRFPNGLAFLIGAQWADTDATGPSATGQIYLKMDFE